MVLPREALGLGMAPGPRAGGLHWDSWDRDSVVRQVWCWNFEAEFVELCALILPGRRLVAFDAEFPGVLQEEPRRAPEEVRYQTLKSNVDQLKPIQLGIAVASEEGCLLGVWSFNFHFDPRYDLHNPASLEFLCEAGLDFARHSTEGIHSGFFGERLAASPICRNRNIGWVVFSGFYDFGYILKMYSGTLLPYDYASFELAVEQMAPIRFDLRQTLPQGSLSSLATMYGLWHRGMAHSGGSDAVLTVELLFHALSPAERREIIHRFSTSEGSPGNCSGSTEVKKPFVSKPLDKAPLGLSAEASPFIFHPPSPQGQSNVLRAAAPIFAPHVQGNIFHAPTPQGRSRTEPAFEKFTPEKKRKD